MFTFYRTTHEFLFGALAELLDNARLVSNFCTQNSKILVAVFYVIFKIQG